MYLVPAAGGIQFVPRTGHQPPCALYEEYQLPLRVLFSAIALLLITVGTYGVLSYAVAQRRREIAIRIALRARPQKIQRHFFSLALRLLAGGIAVGLCGAWATGRAMQAVLFHVADHNPLILAASTGMIAVVAIAACLLPARRAARISPLKALSDQ
jgi:putative ABC transport system permease protein